MKRVVVLLQNAWSPTFAGGTWPRESWLPALARSRSGRRLAVLATACPDTFLWYDNTTPLVGDTPQSRLPPDPDHIRAVLAAQAPEAVVACGVQARAAALPLWAGPLLCVPHPAFRLLTDALYEEAGRLVAGTWAGVRELVQERGGVLCRGS